MQEFLTALTGFPTVVFSCLMALMLPYWLSVIMGLFEIDAFHLGGDHDGDAGHAGGHGGGHGLLEFFSFSKVPLTVSLSVFVVFGWLLCMTGELALRGALAPWISNPLFSLLLTPAAVIPAALLTGLAVRPLRGLFTAHTEHGAETLIGRMVKVSSRAVDHTFGTAICDVAGPDLLLNVVSREGVTLARDDMAVVVEYDAVKDVYLVAPFSHLAVDVGVVLPPIVPPPSPSAPATTPLPPVSLETQRERPQ